MAYTGAAKSLVQVHSLRVPTGDWSDDDSTSALSYWPPGYPAAIALPVLAGATPIQGGRYVNVLAAALTAGAIFFLISAALGPTAGVAGVLVVFLTTAVADVHLSVLSEPLCIACILLTVVAMVYARDQLLLLGVLGAAAVMVRYVGGCAPAAVFTWTLLDDRFSFGRRVRRAMVAIAVPAVAVVAWLARTAAAPDRHGTPKFAVYGGWSETIHQAWTTIATWLTPLVPDGSIRNIGAAVVALLLLILLASTAHDTATAHLRRAPVAASRTSTILGASFVMALWYLIVLLASRLFVGGTIPFDWRILSPIITLLDVMVVVSVAYWWRAYHRPMHIILTVLALTWGVASGFSTVNDAIEAVTDGLDFASSDWRDSPTLAWVRANGNGHTLYSNWPPAVYFHTNRIARELPDSDEVRHDLRDFADALHESKGLIVAFNDSSPDVVSPDSLAKLLDLKRVAKFEDGAIWAAAPTSPASVSPAAF